MSTSSRRHSSRSSSVSSTSSTSPASHTPQHPPKHTPNQHPYPIKTTSTALLTRSNSSGSQNGGRHYYVPLARPASRSGSVSGEDGESDSGIAGEYQRKGKGHKYTRSLTDAPSPLPVPPSPSASPSLDDRVPFSGSPTKSKFTFPPPENDEDDRESLKKTLEGLPPNPKDWSKGELNTYLKTALRAQSANGQGVLLPPRLVSDITQWVREQGMNGRSFVRLGEGELEGMHLSTLWRNALLSASRHLRQNVLKDKIWVDSSSPMGSYISQSQSQADPTDDLEGLPPNATEEFASNLGSISRSGGKKYRTVGRSQGRAHARGKVRGMVENWEKSGSESEGGEEPGSSKLGVQAEGIERSTSGETQYDTAPNTPYDGLPSPKSDAKGEKEEPSMEELLKAEGKRSKHDSWGARAWEEFDVAGGVNGAGVTVKRLPPGAAAKGSVRRISGDGIGAFAPEEEDNESAVAGWEEEDEVLPPTMKHIGGKKGSVKGKGSVNGKERDERRVVTAIFNAGPAPSPPKPTSIAIPSPPPFEVYSTSAGDLMSTPGVLPEDPTGGKPKSRRPSTPAELRHHLGIGPMAKIEKEKEQEMDDELMGELAVAAKKAEAREKAESRANSFSSPHPPSKSTFTPSRAKSFSSAHQAPRMTSMARTSSFSSNQPKPTSIAIPSPPHYDPFSSSAGDLITTPDALPEDPTAGKPRSRRPSTPAELRTYLGIGPLAKLEKAREKEIDDDFMSELTGAVKKAEEKKKEEIERVLREKEEEKIREQEERERKAELERMRMALERAKLEDDVRVNKALLEEFRRRLEDVESKVEAMERAQKEDEKIKNQSHSQPSTSTALISRALSYVYPSSSRTSSRGTNPRDVNGKRPGDPPVSALPSYVLLVSIGMCAVVLRVVLKRVARGVKA